MTLIKSNATNQSHKGVALHDLHWPQLIVSYLLPRRNFIHNILLIIGFTAFPVFAQETGFSAITSTPTPDGGATYTLSLQALLLLSSLTFLPAVVLMMSSFTRIIIVLAHLDFPGWAQSLLKQGFC